MGLAKFLLYTAGPAAIFAGGALIDKVYHGQAVDYSEMARVSFVAGAIGLAAFVLGEALDIPSSNTDGPLGGDKR